MNEFPEVNDKQSVDIKFKNLRTHEVKFKLELQMQDDNYASNDFYLY